MGAARQVHWRQLGIGAQQGGSREAAGRQPAAVQAAPNAAAQPTRKQEQLGHRHPDVGHCVEQGEVGAAHGWVTDPAGGGDAKEECVCA